MRIIALAFVMVLFATHVQAGGVKVKTVEAQGVGETREAAIKAALTEAVARATGMTISARDQVSIKSKEVEHVTDQSETFSSETSKQLKREVQTSTRGSVRGYQIIDIAPVPNAELLRAILSVDVNCFELGRATERMRIAVLPFMVHSSIPYSEELERTRFKINQAVINYLTGTRHFAVLDRDFEKERLGELESLLRADVRREERARLGNTLATDYIVTGVISDFNYSERIETDPYLNEKRRVAHGNVAIEWRVIEAATGQIVVADTATRKVKNAAAFYEGGRSLGEKIGATISSQIFPLAAIAYEHGQFVLAQGATTLRVGDVYDLVRQGAMRHDPYTKEPLGRNEILVGQVRISRVSPKMGYAEIIKCTEDPSGMAPREYLLRPTADSNADNAAGKKAKRRMKPKW